MDINIRDNDNQLRASARQKERSETARQTYMKALAEDDVVLYNEHSRDGGGPDFLGWGLKTPNVTPAPLR